MSSPHNEKAAPGFGGSRGGEEHHRRHHIPWSDDWAERHPTGWGWNASRDRAANEPPLHTVFTNGRLDVQAIALSRKRFRSQLPSGLREEADRLLDQGHTADARSIFRYLDEQARRFFDEGER